MMERTCSKNGELAMTASLHRLLLLVAVFFQANSLIGNRLSFYQRPTAVNENSIWAVY